VSSIAVASVPVPASPLPSAPSPVGETSSTPARPTAIAAPSSEGPVLRIRGLRTYFYTYDGVVKALDGVDLEIGARETLGLVGETGCGKSVTAFSVLRLIADPPGRIMAGEIRFGEANLLWGLEKEAKFKPVKKSNRVKVKRNFRAIQAAQERVNAIRGGGISMIFQEPSSALNPIFSISDQLAEALRLHRGREILNGLLVSPPSAAAVEAAIATLLATPPGSEGQNVRAASVAFGEALGHETLGTQAYHIMRQSGLTVEQRQQELLAATRRFHLAPMQRRFVQHELRGVELRELTDAAHKEEMIQGRPMGRQLRMLRSRALGHWFRGIVFGLPGIGRRAKRSVKDEMFWRSVHLLEGVSIANPYQVARGYPHELSGGMLQRVMIAMALSSDPALLIADEPTTALDVTIQAQILDILRSLKHRLGSSVLLITHDLGVIAETADRVAVMYAGVVVETAKVQDLYRSPLHPYTQGLLNSIPRMDDPTKRLESIPGSVPNLIYPPSGCRFHPRCPQAMEICKQSRPPVTVEAPGHTVACYLYHGPVAPA
jgi:peptide/nickel transport system ATP-binding protein